MYSNFILFVGSSCQVFIIADKIRISLNRFIRLGRGVSNDGYMPTQWKTHHFADTFTGWTACFLIDAVVIKILIVGISAITSRSRNPGVIDFNFQTTPLGLNMWKVGGRPKFYRERERQCKARWIQKRGRKVINRYE